MRIDISKDTVHENEQSTTGDALYRPLRVLLGALMLATGLGKALDMSGFGEIIAAYRLGLPDALLFPTAFGIAAVELVLGTWLLAGWRLAIAARVSIALNFANCLLLASALWRGLALQNCGC